MEQEADLLCLTRDELATMWEVNNVLTVII